MKAFMHGSAEWIVNEYTATCVNVQPALQVNGLWIPENDGYMVSLLRCLPLPEK